MKVNERSIEDLTPHPDNPRQHPESAIKKLVSSIEEFGWTNPILVTEDGTVVAGHARLKAARRLDRDTVPVITLDMDDPDATAYMIADNRLNEETDWDLEELDELMANLEEAGFDDLELGFDEGEIEKQLGELSESFEEEKRPDLPEDTKASVGDEWKIGDHRLVCANAREIIKKEKFEGIDMILSDPPYGVNLVGDEESKIGGQSTSTIGPKDGRNQYRPIKGDDEPFDPSFLLEGAELVMLFGANHFSDRLPQRHHWLVWDKKPGGNRPESFGDVELVWTNIETRHSVQKYNHQWDGMMREGTRDLESEGKVHPAQKPVGLLAEIIKDYTTRDDTILDPYLGSGSTLLASEVTGRRCIGIELDPIYCELTVQRWENYTGKEARYYPDGRDNQS